MRLRFILTEMGIGLRRNLTMTIAGIITVGISLALLWTGVIVHQQVNAAKDYWYGKIDVQVFLSKDVTQAQRDQIQQELTGLPQVTRVHYVSQQEAYQVFKYDFRDQPELVRSTDPGSLPESFVVKLRDPQQYSIIVSAMTGQPGVDSVQDESSLLRPLFRVMHAMQDAAIAVAVIAIIAAVLLVFNTVRVAAFSRRRETGIMRLVGASNFYIQLPFILEGAVAGLFGGLLAVGGLSALKAFVIDAQIAKSLKFLHILSWGQIASTFPILVLIGVALSALASLLTIQRYLRV